MIVIDGVTPAYGSTGNIMWFVHGSSFRFYYGWSSWTEVFETRADAAAFKWRVLQ